MKGRVPPPLLPPPLPPPPPLRGTRRDSSMHRGRHGAKREREAGEQRSSSGRPEWVQTLRVEDERLETRLGVHVLHARAPDVLGPDEGNTDQKHGAHSHEVGYGPIVERHLPLPISAINGVEAPARANQNKQRLHRHHMYRRHTRAQYGGGCGACGCGGRGAHHMELMLA
jgi:hypothetical protein